MYKEIDNDTFVKEIQLLWQNNIAVRELLGALIRSYFNKGDRADGIINKMQEK